MKWIRRKRNSHGFGVQSPNDYYFVQHVLRERLPYYAYEELDGLSEQLAQYGPNYSVPVCRLLFRLANFLHPHTILEVGSGSGLSAYSMVQALPLSGHCIALTGADVAPHVADNPQIEVRIGDELALFRDALQELPTLGLLHIAHTDYYKQCVELALPHVTDATLFVIEGINDNAEKRLWWRSLQESRQTGIAYDVGSVGLLFFDRSRHKDAYWVALRDRQ